MLDLMERLSSGLSVDSIMNMYQGIANSISIILMIILLLVPIWYTLRFWAAEFLVIDQDYNIRDALVLSFKITPNYFQLICLSVILIFWSILTLLLGFVIFLIGLTLSYLLIVLYYRLLLTQSNK